MEAQALSLVGIGRALAAGWSIANATRCVSVAYTVPFTLIGALILGFLLTRGFTPFVVAAAGAFMLVGPAILAGFFGIASAHEAGLPKHPRNILRGFMAAARSIWVIALVTALLFMIFVTDAAILYSYMVGGAPVWLPEFIPPTQNIKDFLFWGSLSGFVIALLIFSVTAFSVPLLCERRATLVTAVVTSVRVVFGNFLLAMLWAALLSTLIIGSIVLLPLLPVTLPWLSYASRDLYRQIFPVAH